MPLNFASSERNAHKNARATMIWRKNGGTLGKAAFCANLKFCNKNELEFQGKKSGVN